MTSSVEPPYSEQARVTLHGKLTGIESALMVMFVVQLIQVGLLLWLVLA